MGYIYSILNKKTNKSYIGQTTSTIKERKRKHWNLLRTNQHYNSYLQHSFNKYGEKNFEIFPLIKCEDKDLDKYEDIFIKLFKTKYNQNGYNIRDGGQFRLTQEMKNKMINSNRKRVENVLQIDPNSLKIVKIWPSQSSASKAFNNANIHLSCKDKGRIVKGYYWILEKDFNDAWKPHIDKHSKPIITINKKNIITNIFKNQNEAMKQLHVDLRYKLNKTIIRNGQELLILPITQEEYYKYNIGTCIDYPREEE